MVRPQVVRVGSNTSATLEPPRGECSVPSCTPCSFMTARLIVDYRKMRTEHAPILIDGAVVEQVDSFKYLGVHITNKLT